MTKMGSLGALMALSVTQMLGCAAKPAASTSAAPGTPGADAGGGASTADLVHCYGVNTCKGHNDCKTAENACAGEAECKTHGFVATSEKACGDLGGELNDEYRGEVASADLVHCYGVNTCGGHNDCKTDANACAGQAECKGHGFVAMSPKACTDVGGDVGA